VVTDAPGKRLLAELLIKRLGQARAVHHQRQRGDYSPDARAATFPAFEGARKASSATTAPKAPTVSLTGLLAKWKTLTTNKPRTVAEAEYAIAALVTFVGLDDAMQIGPADLMRWRDAQKEDGKTNNTWNNRLSLVRQVFAHGVSDQILTSDPTAGLRLRRSKVQSPLSYTDEDALQLLTRARKETRPSLRWAHWVMAFTGMRAGEVLQMTGGDVRCDDGTWYLAVHEDGPGRSIKTGGPRNVPIHDALIAEGFVRYAQTIGADASLFPDKKPDKHGNRGGRAWNVIGKWARTTGGITDPRKAPDHSWRHRIIEEMRNMRGVPEDARNAIVGHTTKSMDKQYGARGENLRRLSVELNKVKSPCPPPVGAA
jgi:integrase